MITKNYQINQKGFTLTEMMVAAAISVVVLMAVYNILRLGVFHINNSGTQMTIQDSTRDGLTNMLQELRETHATNLNFGTNTISFEKTTSTQSNGVPVWGETITYSIGGVNNTQLIRTSSNGNTRVVANDVQTINFSANDPNDPTLITVQLTVTRTNSDGFNYTDIMTGQGMIRNA